MLIEHKLPQGSMQCLRHQHQARPTLPPTFTPAQHRRKTLLPVRPKYNLGEEGDDLFLIFFHSGYSQ
jgi:hypothetical protein